MTDHAEKQAVRLPGMRARNTPYPYAEIARISRNGGCGAFAGYSFALLPAFHAPLYSEHELRGEMAVFAAIFVLVD